MNKQYFYEDQIQKPSKQAYAAENLSQIPEQISSTTIGQSMLCSANETSYTLFPKNIHLSASLKTKESNHSNKATFPVSTEFLDDRNHLTDPKMYNNNLE